MKFINYNLSSQLINLHNNEDWIAKQRIAGKCHSEIMSILEKLVMQKTKLSLLDLDKMVETEILKRGCYPTFKGYMNFPNSLITSVNKQLVHGLPTDYTLQEGDLIKFDFGCTYEGVIVDSATTCIYGKPLKPEHLRMVNTNQQCLYNAIKAIKIGSKLGVIGNAIYKTAKNAGFNVIDAYGGHGIDISKNGEGIPHAPPFVSNKSDPNEGITLCSGLTLAIEPLLVPGNCSTKTKTAADKWTITTEDVSVHHEHTIFIHNDQIEIMTHRDDEKIDRFIKFN